MSYYSETAYTARQDPDSSKQDALFNQCDYKDLRTYPECDEYLVRDESIVIFMTPEKLDKSKLRGTEKQTKERMLNSHRIYYYKGMDGLYWAAYFLHIGKGFFWCGLFIALFLDPLIVWFEPRVFTLKYLVYWNTGVWTMLFGLALWKPLEYFLPYIKDKHNFIFDRQKGTVTINYPKVSKTFYFKDFDPVAKLYFKQNGTPYHEVLLSHREEHDMVPLSTHTNLARGIIEYNFIKHFMDTTRPLPDTPELEVYRHQDPLSKEYDEKTGRNPRYWRDMLVKDLNKMRDEARERAGKILGENLFRT